MHLGPYRRFDHIAVGEAFEHEGVRYRKTYRTTVMGKVTNARAEDSFDGRRCYFEGWQRMKRIEETAAHHG